MPLNWNLKVWETFVSEDPDVFIKALKCAKLPPPSIHFETYLLCVSAGLKGLRDNNRLDLEPLYFTTLQDKLSDQGMMGTGDVLDPFERLRSNTAPIEYLNWRRNVKSKILGQHNTDYFTSFLYLQQSSFKHNQHAAFSLEHAPEWAAGFVEMQRGNSARLMHWMASTSISEACRAFNALSFFWMKMKHPPWFVSVTENILSRHSEMYKGAHPSDACKVILSALEMKNASVQIKIAGLFQHQTHEMHMLTHLLCGHHAIAQSEFENRFQQWWHGIHSQERARVIHGWFTNERAKPFVLKYIEKSTDLLSTLFTREHVDFSSAHALDIISLSPLEKTATRHFLSSIIPAIAVVEALVEKPEDIKNYLLLHWNNLQAPIATLTIGSETFDSLLDC